MRLIKIIIVKPRIAVYLTSTSLLGQGSNDVMCDFVGFTFIFAV